MPCRYGASPAERLRTELVEADVEVGFCLTDMARSELLWGHRAEAERIARDAVAVMEDARTRLQKLKPADQLAFEPLVGELQRVINLVKTETGQR